MKSFKKLSSVFLIILLVSQFISCSSAPQNKAEMKAEEKIKSGISPAATEASPEADVPDDADLISTSSSSVTK